MDHHGVADDDEDPEEDFSEEHELKDDDEDLEEDPNEEHEPEDSDDTEPFEEDETTVTPPPPRHRHKAAMIHRRDDIFKEDMPPQRRFSFTTLPLGCDIVESYVTTKAPKGQYDFVDTVEAGQSLIYSPGHDARTIARAADRAKDVGYVRALQASERRMMTSIEEVNLRVSYQAQVRRQEGKYFYTQLYDAQTDRRDIRLEIDLVREWQCQSDEDLVVTQMMRIHALEARAQTDMMEDADSSCQQLHKWTPDNIHGNVMYVRPKTLDETIELANNLMDQKLPTYAERLDDNKKKTDDSSRNSQQHQPHKKQNIARAYTTDPCKKKVYIGDLPLSIPNNNNNNNNNRIQKAGACYECGNTGHIKRNSPNLKNRGNENHYDGELADGKIIGVNTIIRGCTLNFTNHPFNIDLMPILLGSFDVIIGMHWSTKYHEVIICDEKIVRVPFGREMLIFQGNGDNQREESRLNIISCTKAQEYLLKGCDVFLAYVTMKEAKDKSEGKRLEDVQIVRDFPEVFPKGLSGIPPTRQVEFQIDLVPGVAPVARAPYWLPPSEMKELAK
nr:reverse transcriptase domain-containing protein [Tanacetum cinerariifolium]